MQSIEGVLAVKKKVLEIKGYLKTIHTLIENSSKALAILSMNSSHKTEIKRQYLGIVKKLSNLKEEIARISIKKGEVTDSEIQQIVKKAHSDIMKLSTLYKYLKEGNIHDYIRNQVLKNIVNINSSITNHIDLGKMLTSLKLHEEK